MLNQGEYGAAVWCHEALTDLRTLVEQTWPLESSEINDISVFRDISIAKIEAYAETMPDEERSMILRFPRTRLLFRIG